MSTQTQPNSAPNSAIARVFDFNLNRVRVHLDDDNEPWFVAIDVCEILGLDDTSKAVSRLDDDEGCTSIVRTPSRNQHGDFVLEKEMLTVSESGLYHLIFTSIKPEAKRFRKWVTKTVIPSIRRTGQFGGPEVSEFKILADQVLDDATKVQLCLLCAKHTARAAKRMFTSKFWALVGLQLENLDRTLTTEEQQIFRATLNLYAENLDQLLYSEPEYSPQMLKMLNKAQPRPKTTTVKALK